ncbi:MAG: hypothetical protein ACK559_33020, partial [bacterium]
LLDSLVSVVDGACPSPVYGKVGTPNFGLHGLGGIIIPRVPDPQPVLQDGLPLPEDRGRPS